MKRLSNILSDAYLATGSVNGYLHQRGESDCKAHRNIIPAFRWTQLWFLLREVLKKEGVISPRYVSTTYPSSTATLPR